MSHIYLILQHNYQVFRNIVFIQALRRVCRDSSRINIRFFGTFFLFDFGDDNFVTGLGVWEVLVA